MLKQFLFVGFLVGSVALSPCIHAAVNTDRQTKVYVEKERVRVLNKGFAIVTKDGMFKAKTLRSDAIGCYILSKDICCKRPPRYWYCDECKMIFDGLDEAKKHVKERGPAHRFFYPLMRDIDD